MELIRSDHPEYEHARRVWNGDIDWRPWAVARVADPAFGPGKYEQLARIRRRYDPENVFRHNQAIRPA